MTNLVAACYTYNADGSSGLTACSLAFFDADTHASSGSTPAPLTANTANSPANTLILYTMAAAPDEKTLYVTADDFAYSVSHPGQNTVTIVQPSLLRFDVASRTWTGRFPIPAPDGGATFDYGRVRYALQPTIFPPSGDRVWVSSATRDSHGVIHPFYREYLIGSTGLTLGRQFLAGDYNPSNSSLAPSSPLPVSVDSTHRANGCIAPVSVFSPDGSKVYVIAFGANPDTPANGLRIVVEMDAASLAVTRTLCARNVADGKPLSAVGVGISPDGGHLYVSSNSTDTATGWICDIDLSTGSTVASYAVTTNLSGTGPNFVPAFAVNAGGLGLFATARTVLTVADVAAGTIALGSGGGFGTVSNITNGTPVKVIPYTGGTTGAFIAIPYDPAGTQGFSYQIAFIGTAGTGTAVLSAPGAPFDILVLGAGGGFGAAGLAGAGFDQDARRRPAFAAPGASGVSLLTTQDGGHTYQGHAVTGSAARDAGLWYDPRTNQPCCLYGDGAGGLYVSRAAGGGEDGDWGAGQAVAGVSGKYPAWAPHPTHLGRIVLAYLDGSGALKTAISLKGGDAASWSALGTVATGLDFTKTGRAGLAWLGGSLVCAYGSGSALLCAASADGGATWGGPVTVASSGPYTGICLAALRRAGVLCLAASAVGSSAYTPLLWRSGDLGRAWVLAAGGPAAPGAGGTTLGVLQHSGRLLAFTAQYSDDAGATWLSD